MGQWRPMATRHQPGPTASGLQTVEQREAEAEPAGNPPPAQPRQSPPWLMWGTTRTLQTTGLPGLQGPNPASTHSEKMNLATFQAGSLSSIAERGNHSQGAPNGPRQTRQGPAYEIRWQLLITSNPVPDTEWKPGCGLNPSKYRLQ